MNKKIVIIYYGEYPYNGSWPNRIENITKILMLQKCDFNVVIPYPPATLESRIDSLGYTVRLQKRQKIVSGQIQSFLYYIVGIIKSVKYLKKQNDFSVVFFAGGSFATCYPIIWLRGEKKFNVWIDIVDENSKKYESHKSLRDRFAIFNKYLFDKWLVHRFDKVFVISDFLMNKYSRLAEKTIIQKSVPSIIDLKAYDVNARKDIWEKNSELKRLAKEKRIKLLYAGSVVRPNGVFFVMECIADLINKYKYDVIIVLIVLIGNKELLKQHAKRLDIDNNILILNKQDQNDLPAIYKNSDILFLPEHGYEIANAGFPGKTAELLASGKPLISTIFSDLEKYLINEKNSLLSPIGDKLTYTTNLRKLIDNQDLRKSIGNQGRITVEEHFDIKNCKSMFHEILQ